MKLTDEEVALIEERRSSLVERDELLQRGHDLFRHVFECEPDEVQIEDVRVEASRSTGRSTHDYVSFRTDFQLYTARASDELLNEMTVDSDKDNGPDILKAVLKAYRAVVEHHQGQ